jgi:hypothetical protein
MAFRDALGGFYKLAGVDAVREQIASQLPPDAIYDSTERGLVVWSGPDQDGEAVYDLRVGPQADALLYSATPIRWTDWVETWQRDFDGKGHDPLLPLRVRLLPE